MSKLPDQQSLSEANTFIEYHVQVVVLTGQFKAKFALNPDPHSEPVIIGMIL